jgi:hypothetical protein
MQLKQPITSTPIWITSYLAVAIELKLRQRPQIKKKYKTHNPVVFAVPKELKDKIRRVFELTIKALEINTGTPTDWYNATFRTKHAVEIAKVVYVQETVDELEAVFNMLVLKASEHETNPDWYIFTESEVNQVKDMHEAMCVMEDDVTRRVQLDTIYIADKHMKTYVRS